MTVVTYFSHKLPQVRWFHQIKLAAAVASRVTPLIGAAANEGPVNFAMLGTQFSHGNDFIHNARQLQASLAVLYLRFKVFSIEIVTFGIQQPHKSHVAITHMLQLRHPANHFLAQQTVCPANIRLASLFAKSRWLPEAH